MKCIANTDYKSALSEYLKEQTLKIRELEEEIYNWLKIGFLQPSEKISEFFYFDKRDNQFFSILIADYFHFDENYNIPKNATSSYPENILKLLADRMIRIENHDQSIVALSRANK